MQMSTRRSRPRISTQPRDRVDFPAPESPTRQSMIGRPALKGTLSLRTLVVGFPGEYPALPDIVGVDPGQRLALDRPAPLHQAVGLAELGPVDRVPHAPRVGEVRQLHAALEVLAECPARCAVELVV